MPWSLESLQRACCVFLLPLQHLAFMPPRHQWFCTDFTEMYIYEAKHQLWHLLQTWHHWAFTIYFANKDSIFDVRTIGALGFVHHFQSKILFSHKSCIYVEFIFEVVRDNGSYWLLLGETALYLLLINNETICLKKLFQTEAYHHVCH